MAKDPIPAKEPLPPEARREEVGRRMSALRKAVGPRAVDISRRTGISGPAWSNYEKGARLPAIEDMILFSQEYDIPLDFIYLGRRGALPNALAEHVSDDLKADIVETATGVVIDAKQARKVRMGKRGDANRIDDRESRKSAG